MCVSLILVFLFFKQQTAYEMRISDWSSDVCSSDLTAAFPVRQMKTFVDDTGKTRSEPMSDEDGRPIISQEALEMRDNLVERFCSLPIVGSALDHIIGHFGADAVAEVTGRSRRKIGRAHV